MEITEKMVERYRWTGDGAREMVEMVLVEAGNTVEPKPILPNVTGGEWVYQEYQDRIISVKNSEVIAQYVRNNADGEVMAGSNKLVELVVKMMLQNIKSSAGTSKGEWVDYGPKLIAQLATMGADVREFKGDESWSPPMDQTALVTLDVEAGIELLKALDQAKLNVRAALWLYIPEIIKWRFIVATPLVEKRGPKYVYHKIQSVLKNLTPSLNVSLDDISVVSPEDILIKSIRAGFKTKPNMILKVVIKRSSFNNVFIEDTLVYRML